MERRNENIIVASDINQRDGIGIEAYVDGKLIVEIFRDDTEKTRLINLYNNEISVDDMERYLDIFKKKIPKSFLD